MPKRKTSTPAAANSQTDTKSQKANDSDAVTLLKTDHRTVEQLFKKYEEASAPEQKRELAHQICSELIVHSTLEEEIFYPACRAKGVQEDLLEEAQVEHDGAKILIAELMSLAPDSSYYNAKVTVLSEYIKHHVGEEESSDGIFAKAKAAGVDMSSLGTSLQARKQELVRYSSNQGFDPPKPRSLQLIGSLNLLSEMQQMPRQQYGHYDRDRDEQGRFTSDEQSRGGNSRDSYPRGRYNNDDDRYASRSNERNRDEQGRFTSDDDYRGSGGGRPYRSDEDYGGRGRSGGYGGYGDSERYSEAARRGGQGRGDDDYRGGQGRDDDHRDANRYQPERDEQGRYTSDYGGRSSQQREYGDDYRGQSNYSNRERDEYGRFTSDDDQRYSSGPDYGRSQGDQRYGSRSGGDDRYGSGGDDNRGWHGEPRRHAEAARRGWQNRR